MKRDRVAEAAERNLRPCTVCGAGRGDPCRSPSNRTCAPHSVRTKLKPLIPPDPERCQSQICKYNPFVMGGPTTTYVRCEKKPTWIAKETRAGSDGRKGSMSLCDECAIMCRDKRADVSFHPLNHKLAPFKRARAK